MSIGINGVRSLEGKPQAIHFSKHFKALCISSEETILFVAECVIACNTIGTASVRLSDMVILRVLHGKIGFRLREFSNVDALGGV